MKKCQDSPNKERDICSFHLPFSSPTLEELVLKGGTEKITQRRSQGPSSRLYSGKWRAAYETLIEFEILNAESDGIGPR